MQQEDPHHHSLLVPPPPLLLLLLLIRCVTLSLLLLLLLLLFRNSEFYWEAGLSRHEHWSASVAWSVQVTGVSSAAFHNVGQDVRVAMLMAREATLVLLLLFSTFDPYWSLVRNTFLWLLPRVDAYVICDILITILQALLMLVNVFCNNDRVGITRSWLALSLWYLEIYENTRKRRAPLFTKTQRDVLIERVNHRNL